jgi:hypothetical protein
MRGSAGRALDFRPGDMVFPDVPLPLPLPLTFDFLNDARRGFFT